MRSQSTVALGALILAACSNPIAPWSDVRELPVTQPDAPPPTANLPALEPSDLSDRFELPRGLFATLWAESPLLYNPTAIDVDARGRLWVAEAVNYRKWDGRNPGLAFEGGDRIVILEDADGDGAAESSKVFVEDRDLVAPLGIGVFGERVIVSCSPHAIVYTDTDGDDRPDAKEILLTGFGGFDHDHGLHSFVGGPDGLLWFNVGNAGPHIVTDRSGWTLRSGSIYRDGGPTWADNRPRLSSDDGRIWTGGLVLSIGADGRGLAVRAHNFRNNYELALDSFGNVFQSDNDDGPPASRTLWCLDGGNHGFFSPDGARFWSADQRPDQSTIDAHWHADDPGVVPMGTINGAGGPTGVVVNEGDFLGAALEGAVLNADAGANVVYAHRPVIRGAGFDLQPGFLIRSRFGAGRDEEAHLFRPSDVAIGADGAAYVADWFDPGVGGHAMADAKGYGRILRVAPREMRTGRLSNPLATLEHEIGGLCSPVVNLRWQAWRKLARRGRVALPALLSLSESSNPRLRARTLWLLAHLDGAGVERVERELQRGAGELRVAAFRALCAAGGDVLALALRWASDPLPALRREVAVALRKFPWDDKAGALVLLAEACDTRDRFELEALGLAAQDAEAELFAALALRSASNPRWSEQRLDLAWRLHPPAALPLLDELVRSPALSPSARKRALDGIAFVPGRAAAEAMLALALAGPEELRDQAAWWVRFRDTNDWREFGLGAHIARGDRSKAERVWASGLVKHGLQTFDIDVSRAASLFLVVDEGPGGNGYDWADWVELRLTGPDGELDLVDRPWFDAHAAWGSVRRGQNCEGGPLAIDGVRYERGIGTHADSQIGFSLPAGFTRLIGVCGPDDGGTKRAGSITELEFQLWLEPRPDTGAQAAALARVSDATLGPDEREGAARELAQTSAGALALVSLAQRGRIDAGLAREIGPSLQTHTDPVVRALAATAFAPLDLPARPRFDLDALVGLRGDRRRGQELFFGARATCSSCHAVRGRGGDVGPDLTSIGVKYSAREVFDHVLQPNKAIEFGYQPWTIETQEGLLHTGFVLAGDVRAGASGSGSVILKTTGGERIVIPENEIVDAVLQTVSVMPEGVALGLGDQELADLVAFMTHDTHARPVLGEPIELFNGRDLEGWQHYLDDASAKREDVWSVRDGVLTCAGSPAGYLKSERDFESFVLEVEWRFVPGFEPANSGVLLRMHGPDGIWPRSIEAQLLHRNAGDIWNIGEFPMQTAPERTADRHTWKLRPSNEKPVGEWNRYLITLDEGELRLEVNGELQNTASWCEELPGRICLQSEGAHIEFRTVRLTPILARER